MVELLGLETALYPLRLEQIPYREAPNAPRVAQSPLASSCAESRPSPIRAMIWVAALCLLGLCPTAPLSTRTVPEVLAPPKTPILIASFASQVKEEGLARQRERRDLAERSIYVDQDSTVTAAEIKRFLERHDSPMAPHSEEIVLAGNRYGIDPRMIVAIAGVESQYGKRCRGFNAWGWQGGRKRWSSWSESIDRFSASMQTNYPNWRNIRGVAPRYNPNTPEAWGRKVAYLMEAIQKPA